MNCIIVTCVIFSLAAAAVIPEEAQAQIVKYQNSNDGTGNYHFSYKTSNGITRDETGFLVNVGQEDEHMVVTGSYSYTDVDGKLVVISYLADENGYQVNPQPSQPGLVPELVSALPGPVVATLLGG